MPNFTAVGDDGTILCEGEGCSGVQSSDTGKHLRGVSRAGINRSSGAPLILVVGDDGICLRFVGSGQWEPRSTNTGKHLRAVSFARGTRTAWAVGDDGTILKTTDGGSSFGTQTSNTTKHLFDVWAVSAQLAYACGDNAEVWRTEDGGTHWINVHHGVPGVMAAGVASSSVSWGRFRAVHAVAEKVMAVGANGAVILSGNRGLSWNASHITSKHLRAGWLGDDGFAIAVGDDGAMYINPPGPVGWSERDSGTSKDLNGVLRAGNTLVVVGDDGQLLKSADLGGVWQKSSSGSKHLNAIA